MGRKKNYIFTNKKHSQKAIMGMILGVISLVSLGVVIVLSYQKGGEIPGGYGVTGLLAFLFSATGLGLGISEIVKRENYRFFPWAAVILNALNITGIAILLYAGL